MRLPPDRIRQLATFGGLLAIGALLCAAFWPGVMSSDSLDQAGQGLRWQFTTHHPPVMAMLMGLSLRVSGSVGLMLVLQVGLAFGAAASLVTPRRRWGLLVALAVAGLVLPPVWTILVTLWKDALMAAALAAAFALVIHRRPWLALACATVAVACRHNALAAAVPFLWYWAGVAAEGRARRIRAAFAVAGLAVMVVAPSLLNRALGARDSKSWVQLCVDQLGGIYVREPALAQGSVLSGPIAPEDFARVYTDVSSDPMVFGGVPGAGSVSFRYLHEHQSQLLREYLTMALKHPWLLLKARLARGVLLLGLTGPVLYPYHVGIEANDLGIVPSGWAGLRGVLQRSLDVTRNWLIYRGWVWFLGALALLAASVRRRVPEAGALAASGLLYVASSIAFAPAASFRYVYWMLLAVVLGVLAFVRRVELERAEPASDALPVNGDATPAR